VTHYRAGSWQAAIEALNQSTKLGGENACDSFFMAMAHWQLGDKDQARKWYARAAAWMLKNDPKNEKLARFRVEAEDLLKIAKEAKPK